MKSKGFIVHLRLFACALMVVLAGSCAQMVAPTGGEKDMKPPALVRVFPKNKTTNYNAPEIVMQFDEFLVLNNPADQIVISPSLPFKPEYELDGRKLRIRLKPEQLSPNTTYTINFGNAVGDLHENNTVPDLTYVFSTGDVIDTFYVTGYCQNAFSNLPEKSVIVGLYESAGYTDSMPYKNPPAYFARTLQSGAFRVDNIPNKRFLIFAFKDINNNLKYDANEELAFSNDTINTDSVTPVNLYLYSPDPYARGQLLDTIQKVRGKYSLAVFKPGDSAPITASTQIVWFKPGTNLIDTFQLFTTSTDSVFRFQFRSKQQLSDITLPHKLNRPFPSFEVAAVKSPELIDSLVIQGSNPFEIADMKRIEIIEDTLVTDAVQPALLNRRYLLFKILQKELTPYEVRLKDSALKDIFGQYNKAFKLAWRSKGLKDYCSLQLTLKYSKKAQDTSSRLILQLLMEGQTVPVLSFPITGNDVLQLAYLLPGKYSLRFIVDSNNNGVWDNGRYLYHELPERVYYYPESIQLRANWDLEQKVDIDPIIH